MTCPLTAPVANLPALTGCASVESEKSGDGFHHIYTLAHSISHLHPLLILSFFSIEFKFMSWKTIKLWNLHRVSCNERKRKSLKNSNPPLCKVVYRSKLRLPLLCLCTPVRMQCTWYCIGLHAVRILWRLCRYAEGSVTLMPRCRNEQKTIDNRNRISENDFNCKPALENYQISIKAEFTFSAHFVFGVFILFSLKAFQADIQYRLNAPSLSLSPPNTKNHSQLLLLFHFFSLGDLPSVKS